MNEPGPRPNTTAASVSSDQPASSSRLSTPRNARRCACPARPAGYTLFGSATEGEVLMNLTAAFVATLVPPALAHAIVYGVALSCESLQAAS